MILVAEQIGKELMPTGCVLDNVDELSSGLFRNELLGIALRYSKHDATANFPTAASCHPHHELIYIERGEGTQRIGSEVVRARPGDVFLLAPQVFHRHSDPTHWNTWSLCFRLDALDTNACRFGFLADSTPCRFSVPEKERARWEARFGYLFGELNDDHAPEPGLIRNVVQSIFADVERLSHPAADAEVGGRRHLLERVFGFIDAHYRESIGLRDVARAVHFSPAYLTDLVRRQTGRPIHQWIGERRMNAARLLLAESDLSIAEIAVQVGFRDATYFGRHFAKLSGQTPRAWRETHRRPDSIGSETIWGAKTACGALDDYVQLRQLGERLNALRTRDEIEEAFLKAAHEALAPSLTQLLRRDKARGVTSVCRQLGSRHFSVFSTTSDGEGAIPLVVEGQTIIADDLVRSPLALHRRISGLGYASLLIAPVMNGAECLGAIRVLEREPRAFTEYERTLLAMISTLAGLALRGLPSLEAGADVRPALSHRQLQGSVPGNTALSPDPRVSAIQSY